MMKRFCLKSICLLIAAALVCASIPYWRHEAGVSACDTKAECEAERNDIRDRIAAKNAEIAEYEARANELAAEMDSISKAIATLQNEQNILRAQIELKETERERLIAEIEEVQTRIDQNSEMIGYIVAQYYYNSNVSTVERLASSESFASFVDEEVSLGSISDTLLEVIEENKNLKTELITKKNDAELILKDLASQRETLAEKEAEQASILAMTQASQQEYLTLKSTVQNEKKALEQEQDRINNELQRFAINITAGDGSKGGYPYSKDCPQNKDAYGDKWGMYICECVSYTAWKVYQRYGYMPYWGGRGNANQWLSNARAAGYTVSSTPKPGAVGISNSGPYGHAVWVEAVYMNNGVQYARVSQYNARNAATNWQPGEYSEVSVPASTYQYIYFGN